MAKSSKLSGTRKFGDGIDCLTDIEAQNLCRQPTIAAIEDSWLTQQSKHLAAVSTQLLGKPNA